MEIESVELTAEEKAQAILAGLKAKKSREELAEELGYKHHRSLDMAMRRQGYYWDAGQAMYYKQSEGRQQASSLHLVEPTGKSGQIIGYFAQGTLDVREIAVRVGFANHREMASYMKSQGYVWNADKNNYAREVEDDEDELLKVEQECRALETSVIAPGKNADFTDGLQDYLPYLEWLRQNIDSLQSIIGGGNGIGTVEGSIPRYAIPGVFITKSVHMSNQLDQLVRDFSAEKNISQRDMFAVALTEFFRKYGYRKQIETLLANG